MYWKRFTSGSVLTFVACLSLSARADDTAQTRALARTSEMLLDRFDENRNASLDTDEIQAARMRLHTLLASAGEQRLAISGCPSDVRSLLDAFDGDADHVLDATERGRSLEVFNRLIPGSEQDAADAAAKQADASQLDQSTSVAQDALSQRVSDSRLAEAAAAEEKAAAQAVHPLRADESPQSHVLLPGERAAVPLRSRGGSIAAWTLPAARTDSFLFTDSFLAWNAAASANVSSLMAGADGSGAASGAGDRPGAGCPSQRCVLGKGGSRGSRSRMAASAEGDVSLTSGRESRGHRGSAGGGSDSRRSSETGRDAASDSGRDTLSFGDELCQAANALQTIVSETARGSDTQSRERPAGEGRKVRVRRPTQPEF